MWTYGYQTHTKEALARVEWVHVCFPKESTPMTVTACHPELDATPLLEIDDCRKLQILLGIMKWMVTIGKLELCQVVSYLSYFGAYSRKGHLDLSVRYFGYVKHTINKQISVDSKPMKFNRTAPNFHKLIPDVIKDYPESTEDTHPSFPSVFSPLLQTCIPCGC